MDSPLANNKPAKGGYPEAELGIEEVVTSFTAFSAVNSEVAAEDWEFLRSLGELLGGILVEAGVRRSSSPAKKRKTFINDVQLWLCYIIQHSRLGVQMCTNLIGGGGGGKLP